MITLTTEQAQQIENALLVHGHAYLGHDEEYAEALTVIRAAIAQGRVEQEPVARVPAHPEQGLEWLKPPPIWGTPLYAAPVRTKDLTVSELDAIIEKHYDDEMDLKAMILYGIAADRMKNK